MTPDRKQLLPYVVPSTYPVVGEGWSRPLGHAIHVTLALHTEPVVTGFNEELFAQLGFASLDECWEIALASLDHLHRTGMKARLFDAHDEVPAFILCGDSWFAASCIVMPRLHAWASQALATEDVLVSIPTPEAILVFPRGTAQQRAAMRVTIRDAEHGHRKPLTWELFSVSTTGVAAFVGPAP